MSAHVRSSGGCSSHVVDRAKVRRNFTGRRGSHSPRVSAGLRAGFSQSGVQDRADIALTAYVENRLLGDSWAPFSASSSPCGRPSTVKVGLGSTIQSGGQTGDTDSLSLWYVSGDIRGAGSGWNVLGQFIYTRAERGEGFGTESGQTFRDIGFVVQGGAFVSRRFELFMRYDHVIPDGNQRDLSVTPGSGTDDFRTWTGGFNFFFMPGTPLGKLTVDYQYMFDAQTTSIVPVAFNSGVFASTGPQWTLRAQWATGL